MKRTLKAGLLGAILCTLIASTGFAQSDGIFYGRNWYGNYTITIPLDSLSTLAGTGWAWVPVPWANTPSPCYTVMMSWNITGAASDRGADSCFVKAYVRGQTHTSEYADGTANGEWYTGFGDTAPDTVLVTLGTSGATPGTGYDREGLAMASAHDMSAFCGELMIWFRADIGALSGAVWTAGTLEAKVKLSGPVVTSD